MRKINNTLIAALTVTALMAAAGARAESQPTPDQKKMTPQQISADKDFGKLSTDGSGGLRDLSMARLAIYDGRIDDAKKFAKQADAAFKKAKTDETVFNKAEIRTQAARRQGRSRQEKRSCGRACGRQRNRADEEADRVASRRRIHSDQRGLYNQSRQDGGCRRRQ